MPPQTANPRPCGFPRDVQRANVAVCPWKSADFPTTAPRHKFKARDCRGVIHVRKLVLALVAATMLSACEGLDEFIRDFDNPDVDKMTQFQDKRD